MAKNTIWVNNYPAKLVREKSYVNKKGETKTLYSVSLVVGTAKDGSDIWADFVVFTKPVASTKRNGETLEGLVNIALGAEDRAISVSQPKMTKSGNRSAKGGYDTVTMTAADIAKLVADNRKAYRATAKAQA